MRFRTALMHLATFAALCWLALPVKLCHAMHVPAFPYRSRRSRPTPDCST